MGLQPGENVTVVGDAQADALAAMSAQAAGNLDVVAGGDATLASLTSTAPVAERSAAPKQKFDVTTRLMQDGDWERYKGDIVRIETEVFADTPAGGMDEGTLRYNMTRPDAFVAIMIDNRTGHLIAYTNTQPTRSTDTQGDTHYIENTAIDLAYQGQGLVVPLMEVLEAELAANGVKYITRDSRDYNPDASGKTYAEKLLEANADRVVESYPKSSPWGPQKHIKMRVTGTY